MRPVRTDALPVGAYLSRGGLAVFVTGSAVVRIRAGVNAMAVAGRRPRRATAQTGGGLEKMEHSDRDGFRPAYLDGGAAGVVTRISSARAGGADAAGAGLLRPAAGGAITAMIGIRTC